MTISCIGRKFPSDSTLKNMSKKELIELLKIAEHNYQVQVEISTRQFNILESYFKNVDSEMFQKIMADVKE